MDLRTEQIEDDEERYPWPQEIEEPPRMARGTAHDHDGRTPAMTDTNRTATPGAS